MDSVKVKKEVGEKSGLQNDLLQMFEQKRNVDIRLCVENTFVCMEAHKLILAVRSPVFADMCFKEKHNNLDIIKVDDVSVRVLNLILYYIYGDVLKTDSPKELIEVAKAAQKFEIGGLVRSCKHHLSFCSIEKHNVWSMIEAAKYFKLKELGKRCLQFLKSLCNHSIKTFFEIPEICQASQDSLFYILKHRYIFMESDFIWMEGIIQWLQHHNSRSRYLLSAMDIFSLDHNEFLDLIQKYPSFFTSKEIAKVLCNMLRPGMSETPPWCEMKPKANINNEPFLDYDDIAVNALKIKLESNKKFPKSFFCKEDEFEGLVVFEIKLTKHFPRLSHLVMLELAFGSSYVPRENLELELYHYAQDILQVKKEVNFFLQVTDKHYYLIVNHQIRLQKNIPFVFTLKLRAHGLKKWGTNGPISSRQYRVATIPEDIAENICLDVDGLKSVCLTVLSDWMVFIDPKCNEKNHVLTTFYFDSNTKSEELCSEE